MATKIVIYFLLCLCTLQNIESKAVKGYGSSVPYLTDATIDPEISAIITELQMRLNQLQSTANYVIGSSVGLASKDVGLITSAVKENIKLVITLVNNNPNAAEQCIDAILSFDKNNALNYSEPEGCPKNRVDFYKTFSLLIRMGYKENSAQDRHCRRHISQEEQLWQNELKDLIWLQLQAWHADRTVTEQDQYLCKERNSIPELLDEIINYRYSIRATRNYNVADTGEIDAKWPYQGKCIGCLSMVCIPCLKSQNEALFQIEQLLSRLETAEALYPSSKSFGQHYPLYNSAQFVARVKAMCLWYNMTKHLRIKLLILGKFLMFLKNKDNVGPVNGKSPTIDTSNIRHSEELPRCVSTDYTVIPGPVNYSTQSDGEIAGLQDSSETLEQDYISDFVSLDYYNIAPIISLSQQSFFQTGNSPYRKYIEDVLKTKGLSKSLQFLEQLHRTILRKADISLQNHTLDNNDVTAEISEDDLELIRYGAWSPEAEALGLPPYRSTFLFLSLVPMEVIHEFLRMRLEQKPENPSSLSIRQLMREMKEGIYIAILHRQRVHQYFKTVHFECEITLDNYRNLFTLFDNSLYEVLKVYLQYLTEWTLLQHKIFQKNLLEGEWTFVQEASPHIPGGQNLVIEKFCIIVSHMLEEIGKRLLFEINEVLSGLQPTVEESIAKENMFLSFRELHSLFSEERERTMKTLSFAKTLRKDITCWSNTVVGEEKYACQAILNTVKNAIVNLKYYITKSIQQVQDACILQNVDELDEIEQTTLLSRWREILHQAYRFGFEFYKEINVFFNEEKQESLARSMVQFASLWMKFVKTRCERGRGLRPRWAYQGLDFLMSVCEPSNTIYLSNEEFDDLKSNMDSCISHVVGTATPTTPELCTTSPRIALDFPRYPRSRGSSPSQRTSLTSPISRSSRKISTEELVSSDHYEIPDKNLELLEKDSAYKSKLDIRKDQRIRDSINKLEYNLEERLKSNCLIGCVTTNRSEDRIHIRYRRVTFGWQRGIKIGQGSFGKVYTAVNNETGEMMAMKEIALHHNDHRTIRNIAEELRILEGINHNNLVKYYGIEIHREEMLIFMEFCTERTLECLVSGIESGLPEWLIRKFTHQMLSGVLELHKNGIIHRDIKSANIFLTDSGNCLKIGDFGSAVKIKAHTTMPGELQGFVGTQAYMAPEMFMKTSTDGHGRATDIWSVGCVVIEMAAGKRPWAEFDSNYQIMFKVGMGEKPQVPASLSNEGHDFLKMCLQHDPKKRATAEELLRHHFTRVADS
ncbi:Mekk1 [Carabus blaptoides fortunei]